MFFHDKQHPFDELLFSNEPLLLTALATPYRHGKVHFDSLVRLVELQNKYADLVQPASRRYLAKRNGNR